MLRRAQSRSGQHPFLPMTFCGSQSPHVTLASHWGDKGWARKGGKHDQPAHLRNRLDKLPKLSVLAESWPWSLLCPPLHTVPTRLGDREYPRVQHGAGGDTREPGLTYSHATPMTFQLVDNPEKSKCPVRSHLSISGCLATALCTARRQGPAWLPLRMPAFHVSFPSGPGCCPG